MNLEGFKYAKSHDSNTCYYHIRLSGKPINFLNDYYIMEKCRYKNLPMVVSNPPEILQGFEFIRAYRDKILIQKKGDWKYHVQNWNLL